MSAAWGDAEHGDASLVEDQSVFGVVLLSFWRGEWDSPQLNQVTNLQ